MRPLARLLALALAAAPAAAQTKVSTATGLETDSWTVDSYSEYYDAGNPLSVGDVYSLWDDAPGDPSITLFVQDEAGGEPRAVNPRTDTGAAVVKALAPEEGEVVPPEGTEDMTVTVVIEYTNPWDVKAYFVHVWKEFKYAAALTYAAALLLGAGIGWLIHRRRA